MSMRRFKQEKPETDKMFDFISVHNALVEAKMQSPLTPEAQIIREEAYRENDYNAAILSRKVDKDRTDCEEAIKLYIINLATGRKVKKHTKLGLILLANKNYRIYTEKDFYG